MRAQCSQLRAVAQLLCQRAASELPLRCCSFAAAVALLPCPLNTPCSAYTCQQGGGRRCAGGLCNRLATVCGVTRPPAAAPAVVGAWPVLLLLLRLSPRAEGSHLRPAHLACSCAAVSSTPAAAAAAGQASPAQPLASCTTGSQSRGPGAAGCTSKCTSKCHWLTAQGQVLSSCRRCWWQRRQYAAVRIQCKSLPQDLCTLALSLFAFLFHWHAPARTATLSRAQHGGGKL